MFGLSGGEVLTLFVLAFILMGPKRLPSAARQAAIFIKKARAFAAGATQELRGSLGPEFSDIDLTDLNPKSLIKKQLTGVLDEHVTALNEPIIDLKAPVATAASFTPPADKFEPFAPQAAEGSDDVTPSHSNKGTDNVDSHLDTAPYSTDVSTNQATSTSTNLMNQGQGNPAPMNTAPRPQIDPDLI
jgi:sec-independent protein translocase protein TatB